MNFGWCIPFFSRIKTPRRVSVNKSSHYPCNSHPKETIRPLICSAYGYSSPGCYQLNESTVVVDFQHIHFWYEAKGSLDSQNGIFLWSNDGEREALNLTTKVHSPFRQYMGQSDWTNPESKTHVLLVDAEHNIPISRQWDPRGYPYPIQIAQFGFAYHSRYIRLQGIKLSLEKPNNRVLVDFKRKLVFGGTETAQWICRTNDHSCYFGRLYLLVLHQTSLSKSVLLSLLDESSGSMVYSFDEAESTRGLSTLLVTGTDWPHGTRLIINGSVSWPTQQRIQIHFACSNVFGEGSTVVTNNYWALGYVLTVDLKVVFFVRDCHSVVITQNLDMVLKKAIESINREKSVAVKRRFAGILHSASMHRNFTVTAVELRFPTRNDTPAGTVNDLVLFVPIRGENEKEVTISRHLEANKLFAWLRLMSVANWFVINQSRDGAWKISAKHTFTREIFLKPGWCSAMGQGQGISLLVRAFNVTGEIRFLKAASRALEPFTRPVQHSDACGVRAYFLGQSDLPWYEEYPAVPGVFVLNGFIFSLVGLFDLSQVTLGNADPTIVSNASHLFDEGINTLVRVLPLYDSGTGSFYDLRHLNLAHSYHASHEIGRLWQGKHRAEPWDRTLRAVLKAGPNRARWQYHRVHLLQLHQLSAVLAPQHAKLWDIYFDRWLAYLRGFRSGHN
ncbi:unnamed protein product [Mesocestoides corti]|uniref:D-glucuronyl C5-epimerase C-terminal domain-containing protein n=2 Tax=Mesocestoides corti TaxID=53468 RepID=A0A3P6I8U3_MESCO|nr:unnamed protein product [Mesocestoides corti]